MNGKYYLAQSDITHDELQGIALVGNLQNSWNAFCPRGYHVLCGGQR
jgi:hypothetical protein